MSNCIEKTKILLFPDMNQTWTKIIPKIPNFRIYYRVIREPKYFFSSHFLHCWLQIRRWKLKGLLAIFLERLFNRKYRWISKFGITRRKLYNISSYTTKMSNCIEKPQNCFFQTWTICEPKKIIPKNSKNFGQKNPKNSKHEPKKKKIRDTGKHV